MADVKAALLADWWAVPSADKMEFRMVAPMGTTRAAKLENERVASSGYSTAGLSAAQSVGSRDLM